MEWKFVTYFDFQHLWPQHIFDRSCGDRQTVSFRIIDFTAKCDIQFMTHQSWLGFLFQQGTGTYFPLGAFLSRWQRIKTWQTYLWLLGAHQSERTIDLSFDSMEAMITEHWRFGLAFFWPKGEKGLSNFQVKRAVYSPKWRVKSRNSRPQLTQHKNIYMSTRNMEL